MCAQANPVSDYSEEATLYIAFELGASSWKLALSDGRVDKPRLATVPASDFERLSEVVAKARTRFRLSESCRILSCYEAGRDGFWLHRYLVTLGFSNLVVDPASIEVNRRFRRAKTDRLDATKLSAMLLRHDRGERGMWSVVRVPSHEAEDFRQLTRDYNTLGKELRTHRMRIQSLLVTQGISVKVTAKLRHSLDKLVTRDGMPLPRYLLERLHREFERLELVSRQRLELNKQRQAVVTAMEDAPAEKIARLCQLRGIADKGAWVLVSELLGWRRFDNAKQVGACAGLAPTPYNSGAALREQGISKTGNPTVRSMMVQLAWCWLRYQPGSSLSRWFEERFSLGSRQRRKGIVALARKLLVALWRFLERGVVPEGAQMKALTA